jgi:hypothetical protein
MTPLPPTAVPPTAGENTYVITEQELNAQIAAGVPQGGDISNPRVDLHPGEVADFTADLRTNFGVLTPRASVRFSVRNGRVVMDVLGVDVGGMALPASLIQPQVDNLKATAEAELNRQLDAIRASGGLTLQSLRTTEDTLTVYFSP